MGLPIAIVAGEASGDLLAGLMLDGLKQRLPAVEAFGIGGARMVGQGFEAWWPMERLAVRGYVEVLRHYVEIAGIRRTLRDRLLADPPAVFIGVDAPDFNLGLETALRQRGKIPVVHFVGPSIWAWRGSRIEKIRAAVDHMLVLFPFEERIYRDAGIAATFVGHPLADVIPLLPDRAGARIALGIAPEVTLAALLPGSRMSEIEYIAPTFIQAAAIVHARHPRVEFIAPTATEPTLALLRRLAADAAVPLKIVAGRSHEVLAACDATLVASGTATLEAALFKRPMVIAYKMAPASWWLMKRMGYQPWVGLPNILERAFVVPEFLQHAASPAALATALEFQLFDEPNRLALEARFGAMHLTLRQDTARRAADVVAAIVGG